MTIAACIVLFSLAAVGIAEAVAYMAMKTDLDLTSRRVQPE